jgi:tRNA(Ile)-lysidine synthetase-like protein
MDYEMPLEDGAEICRPPFKLGFGLSVLPAAGLDGLRKKTGSMSKIWEHPGEGCWPLTEYFSWDKLAGKEMRVRSRRDGDRYRPIGLAGRNKIKSIMVNQKLPTRYRGLVPVITAGADIIWLVGYRISEDYKITPSTRKALKVTVERYDYM